MHFFSLKKKKNVPQKKDEFGQPDTRGTADRKVKKKTGLAPSGNNPSPLVSGVRKPTRTSSASDRLMYVFSHNLPSLFTL